MILEPIAYISGCFPDKFGIPRQACLAPHALADIIFTQKYQHPDFIRGLEQYSHLWLIFGFHHHFDIEDTAALVRPQRLGGNTKMGVFATRSTYRPNNLGLSAVRLESIDKHIEKNSKKQTFVLKISGHDLCDQTPIYDIKPYINFSDNNNASSTFAINKPAIFSVKFALQAQQFIEQYQVKYPHLKDLITEVVAQDPRPVFHGTAIYNPRIYGLRLYEFDVQFQEIASINTLSFLVTNIKIYVTTA